MTQEEKKMIEDSILQSYERGKVRIKHQPSRQCRAISALRQREAVRSVERAVNRWLYLGLHSER